MKKFKFAVLLIALMSAIGTLAFKSETISSSPFLGGEWFDFIGIPGSGDEANPAFYELSEGNWECYGSDVLCSIYVLPDLGGLNPDPYALMDLQVLICLAQALGIEFPTIMLRGDF